jgi:hypothetical protein
MDLPHQLPAIESSNAKKFSAEMQSFVQVNVHASLEHIVAEENKLWLRHGHSWGQVTSGSTKNELKATSAEGQVQFEAIKKNEVSALADAIVHMVTSMSAQITTDIYQSISAAAESVGNVVSTSAAGSTPAAFLEMMKKIELSVDRDGRVQLPSLHLGPEQAEKLIAELQKQPPEFKAEFERVKAEKSAAALEREQQRLNKFDK